MDAGGMKMMLATAESAAEIIEKSKPLLKQATMLAQEVTPIIEELNSRDVLGTVQDLPPLPPRPLTTSTTSTRSSSPRTTCFF